MVPPVHIEQVDIVGPESLETFIHGDTEVLLGVPDKIDSDTGESLTLSVLAKGGVLARQMSKEQSRVGLT